MTKSVLVAGGAGFIGSQTCKILANSGYLPVTLDNLSTGFAKAVKWGPFIQADLRDREAVLGAIHDYGITSAIHFAASSLVGESILNPTKYYDNNFSAALAFASHLIEGGVTSLVFSSTAAVYGNPQMMLINEMHPTSPVNPYGASKLAFEQALYWLERAHGLKYMALRYFNAAGADLEGDVGESHEPETHLIPLVCKAALGKSAALTVFGSDYQTRDGTAMRDYVHVTDVALAHLAAIEWLKAGGDSQILNVGTGAGVTVREIIAAAEVVLGVPVPHVISPRRAGDPPTLVADAQRIHDLLNWTPIYSDLGTLIKTAANWQMTRGY